jgi:hypothetical protein
MAMAARRKLSVMPKATKKYIWMRHWEKRIVFLCVSKLANICGTMTVVKQMSTRERLERKKYIGVCRWASLQMAAMMTELPTTLTRYMARKEAKSHICCVGSVVSPRRRNSVM